MLCLISYVKLAAASTVGLKHLANCYQYADRLEEAIHVIQQCIRIERQSLPSTRKELCTCECKQNIIYWQDLRVLRVPGLK